MFAGLLTLALGALSACGASTSGSGTTSPTTPVTSPLTLVNDNITVAAKTNYDILFSVTATMQNPKVVGSFDAFGGVPNVINVYIMNDAAYRGWLKGGKADILLDSGALSTGSIDVAIPAPGWYHLLFSNYDAGQINPAQKVSAKVEMVWQ